ncbi:VOC family protein [Alistipes indistinctus]|uniref:VOC family protein n=1 Tax=Alistipes indistinctus TaxID=626932 RepID=UPI0036F384D9
MKKTGITNIYAVWVYIADIRRSVDFYTKHIGLTEKYREDDWIEFDLGTTSFAILKRPAEDGLVIPSKTRIMFETADIAAFYSRLLADGVKCIGGVREEAYGYLLTVEDPDGHWFELFQNKRI